MPQQQGESELGAVVAPHTLLCSGNNFRTRADAPRCCWCVTADKLSTRVFFCSAIRPSEYSDSFPTIATQIPDESSRHRILSMIDVSCPVRSVFSIGFTSGGSHGPLVISFFGFLDDTCSTYFFVSTFSPSCNVVRDAGVITFLRVLLSFRTALRSSVTSYLRAGSR